MKVAVIGAGPCGLPAIKSCLEEGLDVVCFERRQTVGGLWNYSDSEVEDGLATVMKCTVSNLNKETMSYSDFLVPQDFPQFLPHTKLIEYYRMYADHFRLNEHIRFNTQVIRVRQVSDGDRKLGQWELTTKDLSSGETKTETYDAVLVCTGHHGLKNMPEFVGQQDFQGRILHSHEYRNKEEFLNKKVVIVGTGNSAFDIAVDLGNECSQIYMSSRRGAWILSRIGEFGLPADITFNSRWLNAILRLVPRRFISGRVRAMLNSHFDHAFYGLEPNYDIGTDQVPTINDMAPNLIASGVVRIKPRIEKITSNGVTFVDGSTVDNIDVIICATGYSLNYSFIDHDSFTVTKSSSLALYKSMFVPDIQPPTLALLGVEDVQLANCTVAEMQARYAARTFTGAIKLPTTDEMRIAVGKIRTQRRQRGFSDKSGLLYDTIRYMDLLAEEIGCSPPGFFRLLLTDRPLCRAIYFGPNTSHQYRLVGPGAWSGARQATLGAIERLQYPVRVTASVRRDLNRDNESHGSGKLLVFVAVCGLTAFLYTYWFYNN